MAEKNKLKTAKTRGKGGSISYLRHKGGLFYFITFVLIFLVSFQPVAFAARSSAGGGKIAKPDWGRVATNVGITIGAAIVIPAIGSGLNAATPTTTVITTSSTGATITTTSISLTDRIAGVFNFVTNTEITKAGEVIKPWTVTLNSLGQGINLANVVSGYSTFVATSQVGRAVGMAGGYYDWKPSATFVVSSFATGATAGFLNPTVVLGNALPDTILNNSGAQTLANASFPIMTQGAFVGGLTGLASGAAVAAIDGDKINKGKNPGVGAQVAGLAAGVAAANFSKEFIKPTAYGKVYQREITAEPDYYDFNDYMADMLDPLRQDTRPLALKPETVMTERVYEVESVSPDGSFNKRQIAGRELAELKNEVFAPGSGWEPKQIIDNTRLVAPSQPRVTVQGLLDSTFVKTADTWPTFATSAVGLNAAKTLGKDDKWAEPLVRYSAEGVAGPLFSGAAQIYGLQPSLYLGGNTVANRINYVENVNQMLYAKKSGEINAELQKVKYTGDNEAYQAGLQKVLDKLVVNTPYKSIKAEVVNAPDDFIKIKQVALSEQAGSLSPAEYQNETSQLADLQEQFASHPEQFNAQEAMRGVAFSKARLAVEIQLKKIPTMAGRFEFAGASRAGLLLDNIVKQEMVFGALEGAISGGMSSLANKISEHNYPSKAIAVSYGAALLAGAANGALKYALWEESWDKKGNLSWPEKYELYAPQPYKGDDWFTAKLSEDTYRDNLREYNEFAGYAGHDRYVSEKRPIVDASGKTTNVDTPGYNLHFSKPDLAGAVLSGMGQANRQFLNRALSFGAPQAMPADINSFSTVQYLNNLKSYTVTASQPNGFSTVLEQSYMGAAAQAAANNVLSSMATVKLLAGMFNIQQERLVKTDSGVSPYALQKKYYQRELDNVVVTNEIPYPNNTNNGPQSATGKSYKGNYLGQ